MTIGIGQYESYQSTHGDHRIELGDGNAPAAETTGAGPLLPSKISIPTGKRWAIPLYALAALTTVGIIIIDRPQLFLSSELANVIQDNHPQGVPLLGSAHNKIRAQGIAEQYRLEGLSTTFSKHKHHGKHSRHNKGNDKIQEAPIGCEATILLLRHCEKHSEYEHCNYVGYERAAYLPSLFGENDERWPTPSYIYALNPSGRHNKFKKNYREVEMMLPLAEKANVTVNGDYDTKKTSQLAKHLHSKLKSGEMCGKLAVISWKHEDLPKLARRLGCGPVEGCPLDYHGSTFDEVWQIKFVYRVPRHPTTKKEAKRGIIPHKPNWWVYGSTQHENFDPLQFSKTAGDYPVGGKEKGGSWIFDFEHDERWKAVDEEKLTETGRLGNFY